MSLFVMADLHLSSDRSKSMEVFGARWADYTEKIRKNWCAAIKSGDTVIVPGDVSWGLRLEDTAEDFRFLDSLPGEKLIGKGNHDFWWSTQRKTEQFWDSIGVGGLRLLSNNAYLREGVLIAGTRGWFLDEEQQRTVGEVDYAKIINREVIRLRMSLNAAKKYAKRKPPMHRFWFSFIFRRSGAISSAAKYWTFCTNMTSATAGSVISTALILPRRR